MSEEERRKQACINFTKSLVSAFVFLSILFLFLTINDLIKWSDSRVTLITAPLVLGVITGLILGIFIKSKVIYLEEREKAGRVGIIMNLLIGAILGLAFKSFMSFFSFSLSFFAIYRLIVGLRYFSNKY